MEEGDGRQRKGDAWRRSSLLLLNLILLPSLVLPTPAPLPARPSHRAPRGVCVPPASRHLERRESDRVVVCSVALKHLCRILTNSSRDRRVGFFAYNLLYNIITNCLKGDFTVTVVM